MNASALSGTLLTREAVERVLPRELAGALGESSRAQAWRRLRRLWDRVARSLGPASGARAVADVATAPLVAILGLRAGPAQVDAERRRVYFGAQPRAGAALAVVVASWGENLDGSWRDAVRAGLGSTARWALCHNGPHLRVVDAGRVYARRFAEFDVATCARDEQAFAACWALCRAEALVTADVRRRRAGSSGRDSTLLDTAVGIADRHGQAVCGSLQDGVRSALTRLSRAFGSGSGRRRDASEEHEARQALTMIYRVLFLLYAESRGLVPLWHPVYRDSYSLEALRADLERAVAPTGLWEALQAISRLAHEGCHIDTLRLVAFNGRLFSPRHTPAGDGAKVADSVVRDVLLDLTTRPTGRGGRVRIDYADLGVEQLGAVYERLIDRLDGTTEGCGRDEVTAGGQLAAAPEASADIRASHPADALLGRVGRRQVLASERKRTGTYYTPRALTDFVVRRTLAPLLAGRRPDEVLSLRVVDPAMGSGAFLVAACRFLAASYEASLVRSGACRPGDLTAADRAHFRRLVAERCLFGVDLNPMAVQLSRLSLWLATLAADRPLTFLDHHLRVGDSLIGASLEQIVQRPRLSGTRRRSGWRDQTGPLLADLDWVASIRSAVPARWRLALEPDDTPAVVRAKECLLDDLERPGTPLSRWKAAADLWCASWFWGDGPAPSGGVYGDLLAGLTGERAQLPAAERSRWMAAVRGIAARHRFFHWTLEFPEAFFDATGAPLADGGFDAVLGNPPWDMVRGDAGTAAARVAASRTARFISRAGLYSSCSEAHVNQYQAFVERGLGLLRASGRLGLVVPWGLMADHGAAPLRRRLFERCETDMIVSLDNRRGIFPIHRSIRVLLVTATRGGPTEATRALLGGADPAVLESIPDTGGDAAAFPVRLTKAALSRVSGPRLAVPHVGCTEDLVLLDRVFTGHPALSSAQGWNAQFGRELNATDDRDCLTQDPRGLPVIEGRHLSPFCVDLGAARLRADRARVAGRVDPARTFARRRLAYRDVASATNRLTLIAARLPAGTISTHTALCLRTPLDDDTQRFLCGVLNSFVANWIVRLWVQTHVTVALVERLPVPRIDAGSPLFREIVRRVRTLEGGPAADSGRPPAAYARLQALVARLYGLSTTEFGRVLETFPLVDERQRAAARQALETS